MDGAIGFLVFVHTGTSVAGGPDPVLGAQRGRQQGYRDAGAEKGGENETPFFEVHLGAAACVTVVTFPTQGTSHYGRAGEW